MGITRWLGQATPTAQVDTVTIANTWTSNPTITCKIGGKTMTVTIGSLTTTSQVATTLKEAWGGETFTDTTATRTPANGGKDLIEFAEITATVAAAVVTLTHDTPGTPFILVVTEDAGSGEATAATPTAATGPNHVDNVNNWSLTALPTTGDEVYLDNSDVSLLYGLTGLTDVLATMTISKTFTGEIGLPKTNPAGYPEYRAEYLVIKCTVVTIGSGTGSGSGRIKLNLGSDLTAIAVKGAGSPAEFGIPAVLLLGTHTSNTLEVLRGSVGACFFGGEVSTFTLLTISGGNSDFGDGLTLLTANLSGGRIRMPGAATTINVDGATATLRGTGTITTLNLNSGRVNYESSGTITTAQIGDVGKPAILDCSADSTGRTLTNCAVEPGAHIIDPAGTITYTNKVAIVSTVSEILVT